MNPPSVYELTNPSSQSTSRITNIVKSMELFLSVKLYVSSNELPALRLRGTEIFRVSPAPCARSIRSLPANRLRMHNHVVATRPKSAQHARAISDGWCAGQSGDSQG